MPDLQTLIVAVLVASAFAFVALRFRSWLKRLKAGGGCGKGGCGCAPKSIDRPLK